MTAAAPGQVTDRFGVAFSPRGRYAACLADGPQGRVLEHWDLRGERPEVHRTGAVSPGVETHAVPLDDGRVLLARRDAAAVPPGYDLDLVAAPGAVAEPVGRLTAPFGCRFLPAPENPSGVPRLAVAIGLDGPDGSTVWEVLDGPPRLVAAVRVPGLLTGGSWAAADVLAVDRVADGPGCTGAVVDLGRADWRTVWSVRPDSQDRILLASPVSGRLVVATNASGERRVGLARLDGRAVDVPAELNPRGNVCRPLAWDDTGDRLLVDLPAGTSSRLHLYTPGTGSLQAVPHGPCTVTGPASWTSGRLRFRLSAPDLPPTLGVVRLDAPGWRLPAAEGRRRHPADLVGVDGAAGRVEAIAYGGPGWWRSRHLVVALHGGPVGAWPFAFDLLFQDLTDAGIAVLAPNYRGSTGYGEEHLRAVVGDWGGPDLDDVLRIGRDLTAARGPGLPRPALLGVSYGGFLALLAACRDPGTWSACAALAPIVSPASLHAGAPAAVRDRIERLGGLGSPAAGEPRDVLRACPDLAVPLLLVHGRRDSTVPAEQSRSLHRRLLALGRHDRVDVTYRETDADHPELVAGRHEEDRRAIRDFLLDAVRGLPPDRPEGGERPGIHGTVRGPAVRAPG